jgi:hypothetical protein
MKGINEEFFELNPSSLSQDGGIMSKFLRDNPFVDFVVDSKLICKSRNDAVQIISVIESRYEARSAKTASFLAIIGNCLRDSGFSDSCRAKDIEHSPATLGIDNPVGNLSSQVLASLWMAFWRRMASGGVMFGALDCFTFKQLHN